MGEKQREAGQTPDDGLSEAGEPRKRDAYGSLPWSLMKPADGDIVVIS